MTACSRHTVNNAEVQGTQKYLHGRADYVAVVVRLVDVFLGLFLVIHFRAYAKA
jgi:hypothetical protein